MVKVLKEEHDYNSDYSANSCIRDFNNMVVAFYRKWADYLGGTDKLHEMIDDLIDVDIDESNSHTKESKKSLKKRFSESYDEKAFYNTMNKLPRAVQDRLDTEWGGAPIGTYLPINGSRGRMLAYLTALLDCGIITKDELDNFDKMGDTEGTYVSESKKSLKKRFKESYGDEYIVLTSTKKYYKNDIDDILRYEAKSHWDSYTDEQKDFLIRNFNLSGGEHSVDAFNEYIWFESEDILDGLDSYFNESKKYSRKVVKESIFDDIDADDVFNYIVDEFGYDLANSVAKFYDAHKSEFYDKDDVWSAIVRRFSDVNIADTVSELFYDATPIAESKKIEKNSDKNLKESVSPVEIREFSISGTPDEYDGTYHAVFKFASDDEEAMNAWIEKYCKDNGFTYDIIDIDGYPDPYIPEEITTYKVNMTKIVNESIWGNYKDYDDWDEADIELHKSIDWAGRNYEEYPVEEDSFMHNAVLYGVQGGPIRKEVKFIKYIRSNPIYPPYYGPVDRAPFDVDVDYVGPMYDGFKHGRYDIHDRFETQETYDMLSH